MSEYICKCGQRVQKSSSADNTGNRLKGYGPGHECYGCPYAMPWGGNEWDKIAKRFVRDIKGYECRTSRTLSYDSRFIGSIKDKCTCSVLSLDFDFLEQIGAWVKATFPLGELIGGFSRDEIRPTDYSHNGRYCCTFVCASNKRGISAKTALLARFFNPDGSRKDMTPQQEMEKILADIKKAKEILSCAPAQNADAAVTTAENAVPTATAATPTISESGADASASTPATSLQNCESAPAASAGGSSVSTAGAMQDKPLTTVPDEMRPAFDYSGLTDQTVEDLHFAEDEYRHGKQMAERGLVHMGNAIAVAHDALCGVVAQCDNSKHGNRGDDTFRAWCVSIGITKDTAYRLLQVSALLDGSSPRQQKILKELSPTLLYAVAKPSAPAELVEQVKNGDITTNKQYQEALAQLKAEKDRADTAEARLKNSCIAEQNAWEAMQKAENARDAALADVQGLTEQNAKLQQSYHDADESRIAANLQRQKAEAERDRAEARARNAEDALKKQPITAVVDKEEVTRQARKLFADMANEEVDRRAHQQAYSIAADMTEELKADKARLQKNMDELKQQLAEAQAVVPADLVADKETADSCYLNIDGIWGMALPSFQRLVGTGEDFNHAAGNLLQLCDHIHEELVKMTIANDKETLYD